MPPDRFAVITGAGGGLGRALALEAAARGVRLLLVGRRESALRGTRALLPDSTRATTLVADVTRAGGRRAIADAAGERVDVLIHNAGVVASGPLESVADTALESLIATNVAAPLALSRELLPALRRARGRMVFIGSVFGEIGHPHFAAYSATKHAVRGAADALRRELAAAGVGVTLAAPRAIDTPGSAGYDDLIEPLDMTLDPPGAVAARIWAGIDRGARTVPAPWPERLFVAVQRIAPGVVDVVLGRVGARLAGRREPELSARRKA